MVLVAQRRQFVGGSPQDTLGQRADQLGLLGETDELIGRHRPEARVVPPQQRLDRVDTPARHVELRLVVNIELVVVDRRREVGEQPDAPTLTRALELVW